MGKTAGLGQALQAFDIRHRRYGALVDPDTAFWALIPKARLGSTPGGDLLKSYLRRRPEFLREMESLRFGISPAAVYVNPTERCNLDCSYCYLPGAMRRTGVPMPPGRLLEALGLLDTFFRRRDPKGTKPQIIFHGSEPMLAKDAIFAGIERFGGDFRFGIQTNGVLLDDESIAFITRRGVGLGLSLDGASARVADRTRKTWSGRGVFDAVVRTLEKLRGYPNTNVICTVTGENMRSLTRVVDFLHALEVPTCMLNPVRCTRPGGRALRPEDRALAPHYLKALDRTHALYRRTGRKMVVANFANVLLAILAPTARRLMCDISPCGGGRCFFALSARGDLFPCSEFIGMPGFNGGNIFQGGLETALGSGAFRKVTGRSVDDFPPCRSCAIRHFCGAPCPAEACGRKRMKKRSGAFCELYKEQVRYALRLIADGKSDAYLWDDWHKGTDLTFGSGA